MKSRWKLDLGSLYYIVYMIFKNHDEIMFKWLGGCSKQHPYWIYTKNANKMDFELNHPGKST